MSRTASFSLTDSLAIERCQTSGHGRADVRAIIMSRISLKASQHFNLGRMDQGGCRLKRRLPVVSFSGAMNLMPVRARHVSRFARPASAATLRNRARPCLPPTIRIPLRCS